jgi:two-component system response regulator FlrC
VSVRVLATSNRELREAVRDGVLREDLYYRLNVFPLRVPALRDRQEDILPLARRLLQRHVVANRRVPAFSARAEQQLLAHHWPGNVRELDNIVQRALILGQGDVIDVSAIVLEADAPAAAVLRVPAAVERDCRVLDAGLREREEQLILDALRLGRGSRKEAAERLGISPRTLRYKLARLRAAGVDFVTDGSTSRTVRQEDGDE